MNTGFTINNTAVGDIINAKMLEVIGIVLFKTDKADCVLAISTDENLSAAVGMLDRYADGVTVK